MDKTLIRKEILYISSDPTVTEVHVGVFPVKGRYFRKPMECRQPGIFELKVDLPRGKSFIHYFLNKDFTKPVNSELTMISVYDSHKRSPLILETEPFSPLQFENSSACISHIKDDIWEIRAITHHGWIEEVVLETREKSYSLTRFFQYKNKSFWKTRVRLQGEYLHYHLKIAGVRQVRYYHPGSMLSADVQENNLFVFDLKSNYKSETGTQLFGYQVFPDRFHRTKEEPVEKHLESWGETPDYYKFFGGTIKGIISKLDYIASIGAEFIYLNPVFHSKSYHRYDCIDYFKVDPLLGNEEDLKNLVEELHSRGMKLILDIGLNHCSTDFFAFKDVLENGENSAYRNWFEISSFPLIEGSHCNYSCWHGYRELPQFNLKNPEVEAYFLKVVEKWIGDYHVDGWRLDVCTEMPESFIQRFVARTREINAEALIVAESWHFDENIFSRSCAINGFTNYALYLDVLTPFFIKGSISVRMLVYKMLEVYYRNSYRFSRDSWNFLSNHDVARFYSLLNIKDLYEPALTLLFALPGTPVLYYGEEKGMEGLGDPLNRRCMEFDDIDAEYRTKRFVTYLSQIRSEHSEIFKNGSLSFSSVDSSKKRLILERSFEGESLYFLFNFSDGTTIFSIDGKEINLEPYRVEIVFSANGSVSRMITDTLKDTRNPINII
ncbi:glycoside hydrolase family 13 protein [Fulvivirga sp. 29W222]|uniref:Glycoside hydrolase family 13 protein n=1 Tax=Fulvivirga marina TaxID=2494733 RepID=A0A937G403_9BACT|nr:glycoside hydrolase family 13 protein [Fulvivirga marina]MBL6449603.1 glycoside hydrolase family 13 protein [Fulvivirga marina]